MKDGLQTMTATCEELRSSDAGRSVTLCGWLQHKRSVLHAGSMFLVLRDSHGTTQVIVDNKCDTLEKLQSASLESVLRIDGTVQLRPDGQTNSRMSTGEIEVLAENVCIVNQPVQQLPFNVTDCTIGNKVREELRLRYRYLALRSGVMQRTLRLRSEVNMLIREYLVREQGFVEVDTPTLFCRTPGGAQEFVVPTRTSGCFYSLVQSPQQFKQLLMVGGVSRYFQLARCYRDESSRPDRQPEFTQLDLEMSFCTQQSVRLLVEQLLANCWRAVDSRPLTTPFPCRSHDQCQRLYGTDKPDLRIPWQIEDVSSMLDTSDECGASLRTAVSNCRDGGVFVLRIPASAEHYSRSAARKDGELADSLQVNLFNGVRVSSSDTDTVTVVADHARARISRASAARAAQHCSAQPGDLLLVAAGEAAHSRKLLGQLRLLMAERLETAAVWSRAGGWHFLWVLDFPLFECGDERDQLVSAHHPFTRPRADHQHLIYTNPEQVIGEHYDLVLNGCEVGGGSIRVHEPELQRYILESVLGEECSSLQHLLDALASGAPPHGGIALGMDRLISLMCGADSIRDVLAFPKTNHGRDLMTGSPGKITARDRHIYHL